MLKKSYVKPFLVVEEFVPQEFVTSCNNKSKINVKDHSGWYEDYGTKSPRVDLNNNRYYDSNEKVALGSTGVTLTRFSVEQHDVYLPKGTSDPSYNTLYQDNFDKIGYYWIVINKWNASSPKYYIYKNESDIPYVKTTS